MLACCVENRIEKRNQRGNTFERETFCAEVACLQDLFKEIGADQTLEDFVLIYLAWRSFEPLGNPAATLRLRQMHEIGADGIAVDTTGLLGGFAGQCFQVRMLQRLEQAERVERCFQIAPAAEGVEHAFALFVAGCFRGADSVCEGAPSGLLGRLRRFCGTLF